MRVVAPNVPSRRASAPSAGLASIEAVEVARSFMDGHKIPRGTASWRKGGNVQPGTRNRSWDPIQSSTAWWSWVARLSQTWWTRSGGIDASAPAPTERLAALLAFPRANSPHYREAWRPRPADAPLQALPVVTKRELMADFDRWVTD